MKKILLLLSPQHFKTDILDFAAYIAKGSRAKLIGLFVENVQDATPSIKSIGGQMYVEEVTMSEEELTSHNEIKDEQIKLFREGCIQRGISAGVHYYSAAKLKDITHETRYADLIITDPAIAFSNGSALPSTLLPDLFEHTECPVLVAPEYFEQPQEIVFAYNGSKSSVFAIKQFYYQFPSLADMKVVVLHFIEKETKKDYSKERKELEEWMGMHFDHVSYVDISDNARDGLFKYFMEHNEHNDKILVTGAFGRNLLSSLFKPSAAELVLKAIDAPIFIAHY